MSRSLTKSPIEVSPADLRRAFRECGLLNTTFDAAMAVPELERCIRRVAECNVRRHLRLQEHLRTDRKLAQANDFYDQEAQ